MAHWWKRHTLSINIMLLDMHTTTHVWNGTLYIQWIKNNFICAPSKCHKIFLQLFRGCHQTRNKHMIKYMMLVKIFPYKHMLNKTRFCFFFFKKSMEQWVTTIDNNDCIVVMMVTTDNMFACSRTHDTVCNSKKKKLFSYLLAFHGCCHK